MGPFVHKEGELLAPSPGKFLVVATHPGALMAVREGQDGGIAMVEDNSDPPPPPAPRSSAAMGYGGQPPARCRQLRPCPIGASRHLPQAPKGKLVPLSIGISH